MTATRNTNTFCCIRRSQRTYTVDIFHPAVWGRPSSLNYMITHTLRGLMYNFGRIKQKKMAINKLTKKRARSVVLNNLTKILSLVVAGTHGEQTIWLAVVIVSMVLYGIA